MPNTYFQFKDFIVHQDRSAMKVTTEACLFGAWVAGNAQKDFLAKSNVKALDIGGGTGLLSLMLAQKSGASITMIEIDQEAAAQARENIAVSRWSKRIEVINENITAFLPRERFDLICANPPFYEHSLKSPEKKINFARHDAGLSLIQLLNCVDLLLENNGIFYLIFPASRLNELLSEAAKSQLFPVSQVWVRQTEKHEVFRVMIGLARFFKNEPAFEIITIRNQGVYSEQFIALLKDYYINL
ncbi:MAG: methyltransferase [Chitinophagaceae bacterium]